MAIHSRILAQRIPWTEGPEGLPSIESQRVGPDGSNLAHAQSFSCVLLFETPWTEARQAFLSMGFFPRQEQWSGLPFPPLGDLPYPGFEPSSPALAGGFFTADPYEKHNMCKWGKQNSCIKALMQKTKWSETFKSDFFFYLNDVHFKYCSFPEQLNNTSTF